MKSMDFKRGGAGSKVLIIIVCVISGIIALVALGMFLLSSGPKKLICTSPEGNITIKYTDEKIVGYTSKGISYDLEGQKKYAEEIGIDNYLEEFNTWFTSNTTGSCKTTGK